MYTIACVPPEQNHPKISCSEVRAVPRLPIFGCARKSAKLIPNRISKAKDAAQAKIGVAVPGSYYSGPAYEKVREKRLISKPAA